MVATPTGGYFQTNMGPGSGSFNPSLITYGGQKWPDFVGALHVKQGWGEAQISGVIHDVNVAANGCDNSVAGSGTCRTLVGVLCDGLREQGRLGARCGCEDQSAGGVGCSPGRHFLLSGAYSQSATWYSGLADGMWTENGQVNGNGQPMFLADGFFNPMTNQWSTPRAWSVAAILEHHWSPTFYTNLEASIGGISWSGQNGYFCPTLALTCAGTTVFAECSQLDHRRRLRLEPGHEPQLRSGVDVSEHDLGMRLDGLPGYGLFEPGAFVPGDRRAWEGNSSGFAGRLRITRYF